MRPYSWSSCFLFLACALCVLPRALGDDSISFAAVSDQHYGYVDAPVPPHDGDTVDDWMHHPGLPTLDFVVSSFGDWISDSRAPGEWQDVAYVWEQIAQHNVNRQALPYFFVVGNHDITNYEHMPTDGNPVLKERLGRRVAGLNENNYAFMYDNVLFICLAQANNLYHLSAFQESWVEYLVERWAGHTTVIWTHQAMFETTGQGHPRSSSWTSNDYKVHNNVEWWHNLLDANPQVVLYIHGHTERGHDTVAHDLHAEAWDDHCTFVLVPSNGRLYDQDDWSYIFTLTDNHMTVRLWSCTGDSFQVQEDAGVPYTREGTFNVTNSGMEWLSVPKQVLDGQQWLWRNHVVARQYKLEVVGSAVTQLIDNPELDGCHESDEERGDYFGGYWYGVRGDAEALNKATGEEDGHVEIPGDTMLGLAASAAGVPYVEGKVAYNTAWASPGQAYEFAATVRTQQGTGAVDYLISIPRYLTLSDYVWSDHLICEGVPVGPEATVIGQTFVVPEDGSAWFIQPRIYFRDTAITYVWESWSLKMCADEAQTGDCSVTLNGVLYDVAGPLQPGEYVEMPVSPSVIQNRLDFACSVEGNKVAMVRLIYEWPQLWSDDVSMGVSNDEQTEVYLEDGSPYNDQTSIMSFKRSEWGINDARFRREIVRGKAVYFSDASDEAVNGVYPLSVMIPGDLDGDSDVDLSDLAALLGAYGETAGGDIDGDGDTDSDDLSILLDNYGRAA